MTELYNAVDSLLGFPSVYIGANDIAPMITAIATALVLVITVCNVFGLLHLLFKK